MTAITANHITIGSEHGHHYRGGWSGACFYEAPASALACRLSDRDSASPPLSQRIDRRAWILPEDPYAHLNKVDDTGRKFW